MTVEIKETCCCGAQFYVEDSSEYGNTARHRYHDFLKAHKICRESDSMRTKVTTKYKDEDK